MLTLGRGDLVDARPLSRLPQELRGFASAHAVDEGPPHGIEEKPIHEKRDQRGVMVTNSLHSIHLLATAM
jgi:hypothetical protein